MTKKILIIEDTESVAALMSFQLQAAGFETLAVGDALRGIQECIRWRPDLVLLDLMLPAGGGRAVLQALRKSTNHLAMPILVMTGSLDPAVRKQILEFGIAAFIQKPYNPADLLALIHHALGLAAPKP